MTKNKIELVRPVGESDAVDVLTLGGAVTRDKAQELLEQVFDRAINSFDPKEFKVYGDFILQLGQQKLRAEKQAFENEKMRRDLDSGSDTITEVIGIIRQIQLDRDFGEVE